MNFPGAVTWLTLFTGLHVIAHAHAVTTFDDTLSFASIALCHVSLDDTPLF